MRLVTFVKDGATRLGALQSGPDSQTIVDLNRADPSIPSDVIAFLAGGADTLAKAKAAVAGAGADSIVSLQDVTLKAPVPRPGKILCIGLNYRSHAAESGVEAPAYPTVFAKYNNTIIGHGEAIVHPKNSSQVDYEAELGVVIGRTARHVSEADALQYVGGYAPFNDVSARDFQHRTSQWTMGKTFDTFGPLGPALVTADEIPDPQTLDIRTIVGDEVLQSSNTANMIFTVAQLIADLSSVLTLEPGDLIATGTPEGVGGARKPPRWLKVGETVRVEIAQLGVLENPIVAEA
jgi:2-keto-4-pentenoate hydratase/2-oxohepta-3-ene-1,7-dioic acid hydratase in catechol pathway